MKTLMQEFQNVMRRSAEEVEPNYKEACHSPTSKKYGNWKTYPQSLEKERVMVYFLERSRNVRQSYQIIRDYSATVQRHSSPQMQGIKCDGPSRLHMYCDGEILRT
jgi:hypothetical protein